MKNCQAGKSRYYFYFFIYFLFKSLASHSAMFPPLNCLSARRQLDHPVLSQLKHVFPQAPVENSQKLSGFRPRQKNTNTREHAEKNRVHTRVLVGDFTGNESYFS